MRRGSWLGLVILGALVVGEGAGACTTSAGSASDMHTVAQSQLENGSTHTHSMCTKSLPVIVTPSSDVVVKSVCIASPGT